MFDNHKTVLSLSFIYYCSIYKYFELAFLFFNEDIFLIFKNNFSFRSFMCFCHFYFFIFLLIIFISVLF